MPEMGDVIAWTGARSFVCGQINARFFSLSAPILAEAPKADNINKPASIAISYINGNRRHYSNIITETTGS
jgi:hypothetical protein